MAKSKRRMFQRLQNFILAWPGDETLQTSFNGNVMIIPPIDEVAEVGQGMPYRYPAAVSAKGAPIPGTIVIQDRIQAVGPSGGHKKLFDAAECCAWMEDTREDWFDRGLAICMDPDEIEAAMEEGRPKYEASQLELARNTIHDEMERRKKWDLKGIPPPPSSSDKKIRWALAHLSAHAKTTPQVSDEALRKALSGELEDVPTIPENVLSEPPKEMMGSVPKEEAPETLPVSEVFQMAIASGISLTKAEMARLLEGDDEFRASLVEQIAEKQEGERVGA